MQLGRWTKFGLYSLLVFFLSLYMFFARDYHLIYDSLAIILLWGGGFFYYVICRRWQA